MALIINEISVNQTGQPRSISGSGYNTTDISGQPTCKKLLTMVFVVDDTD